MFPHLDEAATVAGKYNSGENPTFDINAVIA
jgi:hypothetical protein